MTTLFEAGGRMPVAGCARNPVGARADADQDPGHQDASCSGCHRDTASGDFRIARSQFAESRGVAPENLNSHRQPPLN